MTLRVMVVDDEPLVRERVRSLAMTTQDVVVVAEAGNGLVALERIQSDNPDVLLLDVELPELGGFGVISALEPERVPIVIFITAYEQYALAAFDAGAVDYLLKPITPERFARAMARARERLHQRTLAGQQALVDAAAVLDRSNGRRVRFVVRSGKTHEIIHVTRIDWIDAADNYLRLHVGNRSYMVRGTLKQAEEDLDPAHFVRIHRSALVRVERIVSIKRQEAGWYIIELTGGARLRTSRQYLDRVRELKGDSRSMS